MSSTESSRSLWQRVESLFHEALAQPVEERQEFLAVACEGDEEVHREVSSLLAALGDEGVFNENAAAELALHLPTQANPPRGDNSMATTVPEDVGDGANRRRRRDGPVFPKGRGRSQEEGIGPYTLKRVLGEGGMGTVYLAEQSEPLPRQVALKLMRWGGASKEALNRFELERKAMARLSHPAIAQVFDAGASEQGEPYVVLEYIPGLHITKYCDTHRLDLRQRFELFIAVCEGVSYAHEKGVIHRDLKPSNILVTEVGGKPLPKIIDFGIAKVAGPWFQEGDDTSGQPRLGSPGYISPEAATPGGLTVDPRSDVYSLGVVLSQLLVGMRPFNKAPGRRGLEPVGTRTVVPYTPSRRLVDLPAEKRRRIAADRRTDEGKLLRLLRRELDWIVLRTVAQMPVDRYSSVAELAADLRRWLAGRPVEAKPSSLVYRARKFLSRHVSATISGVLALAILGGFSLQFLKSGDVENTPDNVPVNVPITVTQAHLIQADVAYFFGDFVKFDSVHGQGQGLISGIIISEGTEPYFEVDLENEDVRLAGIPAEEIELLTRSEAHRQELQAMADRHYEFSTLADDSVRLTVKMPYLFGQLFRFDSPEGYGSGSITGILIPESGRLQYEITRDGEVRTDQGVSTGVWMEEGTELIPLERLDSHDSEASLNTPTRVIDTLQVDVEMPYFFGDLVEFDSSQEQGQGVITGIILTADSKPFFEISGEDEKIFQSELYVDEIELISRSEAHGQNLRAAADRHYEFSFQSDGSVHLSVSTRYVVGDQVHYESFDGRGSGEITKLYIPERGRLHFQVSEDDGETVRSQIFPEMLTPRRATWLDGVIR